MKTGERVFSKTGCTLRTQRRRNGKAGEQEGRSRAGDARHLHGFHYPRNRARVGRSMDDAVEQHKGVEVPLDGCAWFERPIRSANSDAFESCCNQPETQIQETDLVKLSLARRVLARFGEAPGQKAHRLQSPNGMMPGTKQQESHIGYF